MSPCALAIIHRKVAYIVSFSLLHVLSSRFTAKFLDCLEFAHLLLNNYTTNKRAVYC